MSCNLRTLQVHIDETNQRLLRYLTAYNDQIRSKTRNIDQDFCCHWIGESEFYRTIALPKRKLSPRGY